MVMHYLNIFNQINHILNFEVKKYNVVFFLFAAEAGTGMVGAGLRATLAETGGYIGKGPFGVGGKIGLSADTSVSLGKETGI